jgi:hypothetical protein
MQMDYNDTYGDCTDACVGNILDVVAFILGFTGSTIPAANVLTWAKAHGFQNGANIPDVLTALQTDPMVDANGKGRIIGPYGGVDYTDLNAVYSALSQDYALDLGVNGDWYQGFVGNGPVSVAPIQNTPINAERQLNHSIPAFDYGTAEFLATMYSQFYNCAIDLGPLASQPQIPCIGDETWAVLCIVPVVSWQNTTGESWAIQSFPPPGTVPTPTPPTPNPNPNPHPCRQAMRELVGLGRYVGGMIERFHKSLED